MPAYPVVPGLPYACSWSPVGPHRPCAWSGWFLDLRTVSGSGQAHLGSKLSSDQVQAQLRTPPSELKSRSRPSSDSVQLRFSSEQAHTLSSMHTPLRSGSDSAQIKFSSGSDSDQLHTHRSSHQVHLSSGLDQVRAGSAKLGFKLCSNQVQLSSALN